MDRCDGNGGDGIPSSPCLARQHTGELRGGVQMGSSMDARLKLSPERGEFRYFPRELRERELWQLPDSSRGGSLSGVAAVAARRSIVLLLPQPGVSSRPCFQKELPALRPVFDGGAVLHPSGLAPNPPEGRPSRGKALLNSSWPDSTFSSTASMLSSNSSVRRRFNQALFAASFLDSAFAVAVISHDCYGYSLIGCRGIRIGGPKCTNRLGVLYACDAQVRRCQVSLTGGGRELTVALGSSWPTDYGQSRKRSSELNASGSSNATNTRSFLQQEAIRGTYSVDSSKQRVNTYTGTSNDMRTNEIIRNETARISTNFVVHIFSARFMPLYVELWVSAPA
ncbi:hypothetical protein T07_1953 [Trichinella nelsoni]|uniref:Uncharacterized protein n=1 Tax=Trichinella nelsoni TaxID=6336 RepID=A0A0V0RW79_9BILA|nr:hypothetical protein T07_1953 [Trichinella nelsoni]